MIFRDINLSPDTIEASIDKDNADHIDIAIHGLGHQISENYEFVSLKKDDAVKFAIEIINLCWEK